MPAFWDLQIFLKTTVNVYARGWTPPPTFLSPQFVKHALQIQLSVSPLSVWIPHLLLSGCSQNKVSADSHAGYQRSISFYYSPLHKIRCCTGYIAGCYTGTGTGSYGRIYIDTRCCKCRLRVPILLFPLPEKKAKAPVSELYAPTVNTSGAIPGSVMVV